RESARSSKRLEMFAQANKSIRTAATPKTPKESDTFSRNAGQNFDRLASIAMTVMFLLEGSAAPMVAARLCNSAWACSTEMPGFLRPKTTSQRADRMLFTDPKRGTAE